jgi:superfamily II DNA or RNA helicase
MSRILRPYQQRFCSQISTLWDRGVDRVIGVLPTGGGKTECAAELSQPFRNVLSVCHTRVLCEQLQQRLSKAATWQGLRQRQERGEGWPYGEPDLLVVDEVHVGDSPDWQHVFEMVPEGCKVLGLTATPWRFSHGTQQKGTHKTDEMTVGGQKNSRFGKGLGDLFGAMIVGVTPRELVRNGYLVPLRVMNVVEAQDAAASLAGLKGPSWDAKREKHTGRVTANHDSRLCPVDAWLKYGENRKTMVFCHLVAAAERTSLKFQAVGVPCSVVHGKLKPEEAAKRLAAFKRGELKVLVNVMQLTAGVDVPDISCLIIDRGANNLNTYIQMCGRGARLAEGKSDCLILDLTGCSSVHGDPQKDQDYWVVTSEGRPVSELMCEVCGTRLSPMFPQRCMRCDPFRPKLGDPKELLDTGMRVYCALKDLREQEGWGALAEDERDERIEAELASFEGTTDLEGQIAKSEADRARQRILDRAAALEATRMAEERARQWEASQAEREAARQQRMAEQRAWADKIDAERKAKEQAKAAEFASKYRAAEEDRSALAWADADRQSATLQLEAKFKLYMQRGWTLSSATRDVRQALPRYAGKYSRENYAVPACLLPVLTQLNASWKPQSGSAYSCPAQYELERMMGDTRTSRYGEAWCRKKVVELFGRDWEQHVKPMAPVAPVARAWESHLVSGPEEAAKLRAEMLDGVPF